jgi:hypothetical protein
MFHRHSFDYLCSLLCPYGTEDIYKNPIYLMTKAGSSSCWFLSLLALFLSLLALSLSLLALSLSLLALSLSLLALSLSPFSIALSSLLSETPPVTFTPSFLL